MMNRGRREVDTSENNVLALLLGAYSDEWLAYYQYWVGAKLVVGPMRDAIEDELLQHARQELQHADALADRIIALGGTPPAEPRLWYELSTAGYDPPVDPYVVRILEQFIETERNSIRTYGRLLDLCRDQDPTTHALVLQILAQEVEHREDLLALVDDLRAAATTHH